MEKPINAAILGAIQRRFPEPLEWISHDLQTLLASHGGVMDGKTLRIGFEPRSGELYTTCIVHSPLVRSRAGMRIPESYLTLLGKFNGAKLYALDLYGFLEDESNHRRCMSLELANMFWIKEFQHIPAGSFHFGGRLDSDGEVLGYFYTAAHDVVAARKTGGIVNTWPSIESMLRDEWDLLKRIEAEDREWMAKILAEKRARDN